MGNGIYEHFTPDERDFVDKAAEWVERAGERHDTRLTDFGSQADVYTANASQSADGCPSAF